MTPEKLVRGFFADHAVMNDSAPTGIEFDVKVWLGNPTAP